MGTSDWQRTVRDRKEWWKARSTQSVVLERMKKSRKKK
jgi:hypothetical protein